MLGWNRLTGKSLFLEAGFIIFKLKNQHLPDIMRLLSDTCTLPNRNDCIHYDPSHPPQIYILKWKLIDILSWQLQPYLSFILNKTHLHLNHISKSRPYFWIKGRCQKHPEGGGVPQIRAQKCVRWLPSWRSYGQLITSLCKAVVKHLLFVYNINSGVIVVWDPSPDISTAYYSVVACFTVSDLCLCVNG